MSESCLRLLEAAGCDPRVIDHCLAVRASATRYLNPLADPDLVVEGAMLHDIGRGQTHGLGHGQAGATFLRNRGMAEPLARIVECHIGAGLSADECTLYRLLPRECVPRTLEEKIVAHADNMVQGTTVYRVVETMLHQVPLDRRVRKRLYRLALEIERCTDLVC